MLQPFRKGVALVDQAKPIADILKEVTAMLNDAKASADEIATPDTETDV